MGKVISEDSETQSVDFAVGYSGDTWQDYIPVFIANGFYKNRTEFTREHIVYSRFSKFPKVDRYLNTGKLIRHRNDILVNMDFRRTTVSHHEDIIVSYDIETYKDVGRTRWDPYKNEPIQNAGGLCYIWRKIVNTAESRQIALLEIIEKHLRAIIFYNFDYELELLKNLFVHFRKVIMRLLNGMDIAINLYRNRSNGSIWFNTMQERRGGTVSRRTQLYFTHRTTLIRL